MPDSWTTIKIRDSTLQRLKVFNECEGEGYDDKIAYLLDFIDTLKSNGVWDVIRGLL